MNRGHLLAFKRGPTVELKLDDLSIEVRHDRVVLSAGHVDGIAWLSWEEWRDLSRRISHSISWVEEHTPLDALSPKSFDVDDQGLVE